MGEWKAGEISYLKANRAACALCGHPIAIRYWGAEVERRRADVLLARARAALPRLLAPTLSEHEAKEVS